VPDGGSQAGRGRVSGICTENEQARYCYDCGINIAKHNIELQNYHQSLLSTVALRAEKLDRLIELGQG
jgi:hypothetical protein